VTDEKAKLRMISEFSIEATQPEWALAYKFDIVLRGRQQTIFEEPHE
jgi:protocatechuate 3,4-dioxygenase, beta subunit